jgi:hypothetical protein
MIIEIFDRDFESERVGDAPFELDRVGVLAGAAQPPRRGWRSLAGLLAGPAPLLDLAAAEPLGDADGPYGSRLFNSAARWAD